MKNKKLNLDMLENANSEILEQLSDEDKLSDAEKDRMFELSIKYYYGEVSDNTKSKNVDMQAEVKNRIFFRKNTAVAAVLLIVLVNAVIIGALKTKNDDGITNYGNGNDQVVSSMTSDTGKENVIIHADTEITSVNKKISRVATTAEKSETEKENSMSAVKTEDIPSVSEAVSYEVTEEQIRTEKESEMVKNTVTEPENKPEENKTEAVTTETDDIERLVRLLDSQKYISSSDTVRSDFSFSPDGNTIYFIEQTGCVWKYNKSSENDSLAEEAKLNDEDLEVVNGYLESYGNELFKIYPVDTDFLEIKLKSLSYTAPSGDGIPKYTFSPNALYQYEIDLENRLVWRSSVLPNGETVREEAKLTSDIYSVIEKCIAFYGDSVFGWL